MNLNPIYPGKSHLVSLKDFRLSGKVRSVRISRYHNDEVTGYIEHHLFNRHGNIRELRHYSSKGLHIYSKSLYHYDEQQKIVSIKEYDAKPRMTYEERFSYNDKGDYQSYIGLDFGVTELEREQVVYGYDALGKISEFTVSYAYDGWEATKRLFKTDQERRIVLATIAPPSSSTAKTIYLYSADSKFVEAHTYDAGSDQPTEKAMVQFDACRHPLSREHYDAEEKLVMGEYWEYDEQGNVIRHTSIDNREKITSGWQRDYQYDGMGNWVVGSSLSSSVLVTERRELEYFA